MVIKCDFCGKDNKRPPCHIKRNKNNFCDNKCHSNWRRGKYLRENNPNWRGGKSKCVNGYIAVYRPEHPRVNSWGYVYEHIIIAEDKYGVSTKGKYVHHLNGIKDDNRPENLVIVNPRDHEGNTFKKILQAKIREQEQIILDLRKQVADDGFNKIRM